MKIDMYSAVNVFLKVYELNLDTYNDRVSHATAASNAEDAVRQLTTLLDDVAIKLPEYPFGGCPEDGPAKEPKID